VLEAVQWLEGRAPVLAVDLPSGLDGSTGTVAGEAVRAHYTLTFARSMPGLHLGMVAARRGRLRVADIGLVADPEEALSGCARLIDPEFVGAQLVGLAPAAHKGRRGHVLVVGGSRGTEGACVLSGAGALGGGAGLVTLCSSSAELGEVALSQRPELMRAAWGSESWTKIGDVLVVGPGLTDAVQLTEVSSLWTDDSRPSVWDASALSLNLKAGELAGARIITPHPKEAAGLLARLSGETWEVSRVQADRIAAARRLAALTGAVVVLKGAGSVVSDGLRCFVNTSGDERLATAGSGDVLAGLLAALLARGLGALEAACVGVHLHGLAGERQASVGARALDLCDVLPEVLGGPDYRGRDWPEFVLA
jgi:NAD(P)H-hydrate epimerase